MSLGDRRNGVGGPLLGMALIQYGTGCFMAMRRPRQRFPNSLGTDPTVRSAYPESALSGLAHPRLRRASVISRFAAAAGLEALQAAGLKVDSQNARRIALIFAISNGGVIYTKRFYRDVDRDGCAVGQSPLVSGNGF